MSKYNIAGFVLCIGGLLLVLFQSLSAIMTPGDVASTSLTIVDVVDAQHFSWIDGTSLNSLQKAAKFIVTMPLYILLICCGVLSFIAGAVFDK